MTARIPVFLPIPLTVIKNREELVLYRQKRDFGVTAEVVSIIAACATAATVAGLALSQSAAAASTIDQLAERVSEGLQKQNTLNAQIHMGILNLNQQTALLQEQVDALWKMHDATCSHFFRATCVTPLQVQNASEQLRVLNTYLRGPWNVTFVNFTSQLANQIVRINETRVPPISGETWWNNMALLRGWVQRWVGSLALAIIGTGVTVTACWGHKRLYRSQRHHQRATTQVMLSLARHPRGEVPQVWLNMLQEH
ncbi:uncharacterized protein LOC132538136 [Erinaceus europaeus]|uniref:Uncharacterized protein LOC132538136 n=1 Tax=Erinaceus europaeus TaxID=9365 RepID=A0ABM3XC08_ERIEU|nr:uncharacterized protein LOC132538136 [Erinaceus europaeus]XP_060046354.1 uncharacterized protein LOC132538136 [Erinaceus europaeus]